MAAETTRRLDLGELLSRGHEQLAAAHSTEFATLRDWLTNLQSQNLALKRTMSVL